MHKMPSWQFDWQQVRGEHVLVCVETTGLLVKLSMAPPPFGTAELIDTLTRHIVLSPFGKPHTLSSDCDARCQNMFETWCANMDIVSRLTGVRNHASYAESTIGRVVHLLKGLAVMFPHNTVESLLPYVEHLLNFTPLPSLDNHTPAQVMVSYVPTSAYVPTNTLTHATPHLLDTLRESLEYQHYVRNAVPARNTTARFAVGNTVKVLRLTWHAERNKLDSNWVGPGVVLGVNNHTGCVTVSMGGATKSVLQSACKIYHKPVCKNEIIPQPHRMLLVMCRGTHPLPTLMCMTLKMKSYQSVSACATSAESRAALSSGTTGVVSGGAQSTARWCGAGQSSTECPVLRCRW